MRATDRGGAHQFHIRHSMGVMDCVHEESRTGQTASPPVCQIYWYPVPFDLDKKIRTLCDVLSTAEGRVQP
jgi:hypothetical protein